LLDFQFEAAAASKFNFQRCHGHFTSRYYDSGGSAHDLPFDFPENGRTILPDELQRHSILLSYPPGFFIMLNLVFQLPYD
jgi:hypothetical protein